VAGAAVTYEIDAADAASRPELIFMDVRSDGFQAVGSYIHRAAGTPRAARWP